MATFGSICILLGIFLFVAGVLLSPLGLASSLLGQDGDEMDVALIRLGVGLIGFGFVLLLVTA